jgi:hypothetical protein
MVNVGCRASIVRIVYGEYALSGTTVKIHLGLKCGYSESVL